MQSPPSQPKESSNPITGLTWDMQYFLQARYSRQESEPSDMTYTYNTLTFNHADSGSSGNVNYTISSTTWRDSTKSWTTDEWIDHYLKVGSSYWLITDSATDALRIEVDNQSDPSADDYEIVPFKPGQLIGAYLRPDNTQSRKYKILNNTETVITISPITLVSDGTVTTGDASAPYQRILDSSMDSTYLDDHFNDYSVYWNGGDNAGESDTIGNYVSNPSEIAATTGFTNSIDIGDTFIIRDDLLWANTSDTFEITGYQPPQASDFLDTTLVDNEDIRTRDVATVLGEIDEQFLPDNINAIYSIGFEAGQNVNLALPLDCIDAIKIKLKNEDTGDVSTLIDSGMSPNTENTVRMSLHQGIQYRLDIAFYADNGDYGFRFMQTQFPLGYYINSWDSPQPDAPVWETISGGTGGSDPDAEAREIVLTFTHSSLMFGS